MKDKNNNNRFLNLTRCFLEISALRFLLKPALILISQNKACQLKIGRPEECSSL